jgi:large subunit ribosomal protein L15
MNLTDLRPAEGATHAPKRVGRGHGSGMGKTSTRGANGQGQRSGESRKPGFEGGQKPLFRRLPKQKSFRAPKRAEWSIVNLYDLTGFAAGTVVDAAALMEAGKVKQELAGLRVLGTGDISVALTVRAHHFTASAREKIEAAGGKAELLGGDTSAESAEG